MINMQPVIYGIDSYGHGRYRCDTEPLQNAISSILEPLSVLTDGSYILYYFVYDRTHSTDYDFYFSQHYIYFNISNHEISVNTPSFTLYNSGSTQLGIYPAGFDKS